MEEWTDEYNPFNSWKSLAWAERMKAIVNGKFMTPVTLNLDLIEGCNYDCTHCAYKHMKNRKSIVPTNIAMKIPRFASGWGVQGACIAGGRGDPLLHPDLDKILKEFHRWKIDVGLTTNGFAFDDKTLRAAAHYCRFVGFSVDAGTKEAYTKVHNVPENYFETVVNNMKKLYAYKKNNKLGVQIGYKCLILPDSYDTLYEAARIARDAGAEHFQIRPAKLSLEETRKIDVETVNEQIRKATTLETNSFKIFGVRHKFKKDLTKKSVTRCYITPLTTTWLANGNVILCLDSRDERYTLCNYIRDGLETVKNVWGSKKHKDIVKKLNKNLDKCRACTCYKYNEIIENVFVKDNMDKRLL